LFATHLRPKRRFDWDEYREVVKVFTRMLDNVVEINGLPLPGQRDEIMREAPPTVWDSSASAPR
jgi:ribonucleotide reductase alpha subunit